MSNEITRERHIGVDFKLIYTSPRGPFVLTHYEQPHTRISFDRESNSWKISTIDSLLPKIEASGDNLCRLLRCIKDIIHDNEWSIISAILEIMVRS